MPQKKKMRIGLTVLSLTAALLSMPLVMFSPMMFDAPGSDKNALTQLLFYSILAFPVLCLMGGILPWIFKRHRLGIWLYALSGLAIGLFVVAAVLLELQCGGSFAC